jgi:hypothetical protein
LAGVHGTEETARWLWNHRFAAVAGDSMAFEALPPLKPDGTVARYTDLGESTSGIWRIPVCRAVVLMPQK